MKSRFMICTLDGDAIVCRGSCAVFMRFKEESISFIIAFGCNGGIGGRSYAGII